MKRLNERISSTNVRIHRKINKFPAGQKIFPVISSTDHRKEKSTTTFIS
jgi:molybdopterin synthase catalytic subunit